MERVIAIRECAIDESLPVAVLIGEPDADQRHIGILHRTAGFGSAVLHLAWHCHLRNDSLAPDYFTVWVAPSFVPERLRSLAALCRRVWKKNGSGGIPYAFSNPRESIDAETGAYLIGPSRFGLTCATFVLALFDAAGLRLVDYSTWPIHRPGDDAWRAKIIGMLENRASKEHLEHLRNEIGCVRFRPEEIAAATAIAPPPATFPAASVLGEQIIARIRQCPNSSGVREPSSRIWDV